MAAVTLKDLMDPLNKIQAAMENQSSTLDALTVKLAGGEATKAQIGIFKRLDALTVALAAGGQSGAEAVQEGILTEVKDLNVSLASGGQSGADAIQLAILNELKLQTKLMEKKGGGLAGLFGGSGGKKSGLAQGGNAFKMLGAGTVEMAKGLLLFMLVPTKTIKKYNEFVKSQIDMWAKSDPKKMDAGANAMMVIGDSILNFSKSLALAAILLIPAAIGLPLLYIATALVVPLFLLLGMGEKQITKGANAMDKMGDGLKSFAVGLALFAITTFFILMQPAILIGMVASLVLIGGAVAILGIFDKQIKKGSVALAMMGVGLAIFGLGYALFAFTIAKTAPTLESIAIQAGVLIGIGIVTAILGSLFSLIIQGAASLAAMGIGLLIFGLGYIPFSFATKDTTLADVGVQSALLTALGLLFAAAGAGALFIIPGAAAFAAIGVALLALAPGLTAIKKVDFTEDDALKLTTTLAGVKAAFVGPPGKGGVGGFFKSIGGALTGAVDSVKMIAAAAGFAAAGGALILLSKGLKAYKKLDWQDADTLELSTMLTGVSGAFAQAGGVAATPTGLFGKVFGNAFSPNATKKGIDSVMGAGKALTNIAEGLKSFQKLIDSGVEFGDPNREGGPLKGTLAYAVINTVGFVKQAFAAIGGADQSVESGGFFSGLFGIKSTATEEGIRSVKGAGTELNNIAKGLEGFQKLIESKVNFGDPANPQPGTLAYAVINTVGFVQQAFAAIGSQEDVDKGGFFGGLFGIKQNAVQKGIQSVSGAGEELSKIADAISTFSGIKNPQETASRIKEVLTLVGDAFASIGGSENTDSKSSLFGLITWDENKIQKGIEAVDGAGGALTDIAKGLKAFDGFDGVKVATAISTLLTSIGTTFSDLYNTNPFISDELDDFTSFIVTIGDVAERGQLEKAAEGITKIADAINKIDVNKTVAFGTLFKSAGELSGSSQGYRALGKAVEEIRDMLAKQGSSGGIDGAVGRGFDKIFGTTPKEGAPAAGGGSAFGSPALEKTLATINSTMNSLPGKISTAISTADITVKNSEG